MKKLLKQLIRYSLLFFSFLIILNLFALLAYRQLWIKPTIKQNEISGFGDSHMACSLNDKIINDSLNEINFSNYGKGGKSMFWVVMSARAAYNQGCRNFVFEVSPGILNSTWKTTDKERGTRELRHKYVCELNEIYYLLMTDWFFGLKVLFEQPFYRNPVDGGYNAQNTYFHEEETKEEIAEKKQQLEKTHDTNYEFSGQLLIDFINKHNDCEFLVFSSPVLSKNYQENSNFEKFKHQLKPNLNILDFQHLYSNANYFSDRSHLNTKGSIVFSNMMVNEIRNRFN